MIPSAILFSGEHGEAFCFLHLGRDFKLGDIVQNSCQISRY